MRGLFFALNLGMRNIRFSIITPSRGDRPRALAQAMASVERAWHFAQAEGMDFDVEMLVGFDGLRPDAFDPPTFVRHVVFPKWGSFGNRIRHALMKIALGEYLLFVDDDNALTQNALVSFARHDRVDVLIGCIDSSRAFQEPVLPRLLPSGERVAQGNIDPLCLCVCAEFARVRGLGWQDKGGYESDYLNILRYFRRAREVLFVDDVVGIYDAGRGLDAEGMNARQRCVSARERAGQSLPSASPWRGR